MAAPKKQHKYNTSKCAMAIFGQRIHVFLASSLYFVW